MFHKDVNLEEDMHKKANIDKGRNIYIYIYVFTYRHGIHILISLKIFIYILYINHFGIYTGKHIYICIM